MRLADFIEQHDAKILAGAEAFAETQAPAGVELSVKELRNHLPQILKAVVRDLRSAQSAAEQHAKSEGAPPKTPAPSRPRAITAGRVPSPDSV